MLREVTIMAYCAPIPLSGFVIFQFFYSWRCRGWPNSLEKVQDIFIFSTLKVHKHEIILNFFLPKSNPYMPFVNFRKKFCIFSFDFRQNFDVRTFPRWLSIRGTKFFLRDIQKNFFFKIFTLVLVDRFPRRFFKIWIFYRRNLHFN